MSSDGVALLLTASAASAILYLARRRRLQPPKKAQPIAPDTSKIKLQTTPDELLYNAKLHIDEDHRMARPRVPKKDKKKKDEL